MDLEMESANAWMCEHYVAIRVSSEGYYLLFLSICNIVDNEDVLENCAVLEDGEDWDFQLVSILGFFFPARHFRKDSVQVLRFS